MTCGGCGSVNRDGAAFCAGCGSPLARACGSCGNEVSAVARFCDRCGAAVQSEGQDPAPLGDRKVVSILFADLSGSTAMQERLDAEATARVMATVHTLLRDAVESNGGRVVKFTGDGVMAVFGVPVLQEDDAVRAVRAAIAMQRAFGGLALPDDVGLRVGVNTGEVVVSPDSDDVVGDPVNVAARLEAAAEIGDVFVGPETQRLVRDVIALDPVEPLTVKGKAEPVLAARVASEADRSPTVSTTFLGRDGDIAALLGALDEAEEAAAARLVTVVGWPGLGKSRLASELAHQVESRATVVEVRFIADGGSSFGPIADALRRAVDLDALDLGAEAERVTGTIGALLGAGTAGSTEQIFWAIRRALEAMAVDRPVLLVLDDVHWAEPAMLDLVEHLTEWLRAGPVLLLALARPELRDLRPSLLDATGPSSHVLALGGLDVDACRHLALDVLETDTLPEGVVARALEASEGNPLFLRELLRLLVDDGVLRREGDGWALTVEVDAIELPSTIHAALAARIEQLSADERLVLQTASVIGRHFARGAVAALLPPQTAARLDEHLVSLHRRALVDPEGTWWVDERMYRFHHVLIRDAAYRRVLKEVRADLHVRYAEWLAARVGDGVAEHDEILGFHLEQAVAYRRALGDEVAPDLVASAVSHLSAAGRRALEADDLANAAAILARAVALAPDDAELLRDRCEALVAGGDVHAASDVVAALAGAAGDERSAALADVYDAQLAAQRSSRALRDVADRAASAARVLAAHGDDVGVAKAEAVAASALGRLGQVAACEAALDRSLAAARRAGNTRLANVVLSIAPTAALWGPSPIPRASGRCLDVVRVLRITSWAPHVEAHALRCQAVLEAMRDRPDAARRMLATARATFTDLGHRWGLLEAAMDAGVVELLAGEPAAAESHLREAVAGFEALGAQGRGAQAVALLARSLLELGRVDAAAAVADPSLAGDDLKASIGLLCVKAEVLVRRGEPSEAETLARRAVELAEPTDALVDHADARISLATVLSALGLHAEADAERERARALYEAKGATVGLARAGAPAITPPNGTTTAPVDAGRRVRANQATATAERWLAARQRGDWGALPGFYTEDWSSGSHRLGSLEQPDGTDAETLSSLRSADVAIEQEVVASLGARHCLLRRTWRHHGRDDRGAYEMHNVSVVRVDVDGRIVRMDTFEAHDLVPALGCLLTRWAEDEAGDPERAAAIASCPAWSFASTFRARDWDTWGAQFTEGVVLTDHRPSGTTISGRRLVVDWARDIVRAAPDAAIEAHDVLGFAPEASLYRMAVTGSADGGPFVIEYFSVIAVDGTGIVRAVDLFPLDSLAAAWSCFDRHVDASAPDRRVRANLATASAERWAAAIAAGDPDAADAEFRTDLEVHAHSLHVSFGASEQRESNRWYAAHPDAALTTEHVATLGERHLLKRARLQWGSDAGGRELSGLEVHRVDATGRVALIESFDPDDMAAATACLIARWAEDELDGSARARARQMAKFFEWDELVRDRRWDDLALVYDADVMVIDRRGTSQTSRGVAPVIAWLRDLRDRAESFAAHLDDVVALTPAAALYRRTLAGSVDGAQFDWSSITVAQFGPSGHVVHMDHFGSIDEAWECFDRLESPRRRRVTANAATTALDRWGAAARVHDVTGADALFAPDVVVVRHDQHIADPAQAWRNALVGVVRDGEVDLDVLASLGERHALIRAVATWDALASANVASELAWTLVVRVGRDGRIVSEDVFANDDLGAACACLVERWAEDELDAARQQACQALVAGWGLPDAYRDGDWVGLSALLSPDAALIDHRTGAAGEVAGRDAIVGYCRAFRESADGARIDLRDVLALTPLASLTEVTVVGTSRGTEFELPSLALVATGVDGRIRRLELFAVDSLDEAWAAFDATVSSAVRERLVPSNLAIEATWRVDAAIRAHDLETLDALYTDDFVVTNELLQADMSRRDHERVLRRFLAAARAAVFEPLAALGRRHALVRAAMTWRPPEGGEAELCSLYVSRADETGRLDRQHRFAHDDLARALACLFERWAEDELDGAARERALRTAGVWSYGELVAAQDWAGYGDLVASDAVQVDHRPTGVGEIRGRAALVAWIRELAAVSEELRADIVDVLALTPDAALVRNVASGVAAGGPYSIASYVAFRFGSDGRLERVEFFPEDRLDDAWACFDRLDTAVPVVVGNAATAIVERWTAALHTGDVDAAHALYAPGYELVRHDQHLTEDRDTWLETEALLSGRASVSARTIATVGDRHALTSIVTEIDGDVRLEFLYVMAADGSGHCVREDLFRHDDLSAALACLVRRHAEDELDGDPVAFERAIAKARACRFDVAVTAGDVAEIRSLLAEDAVLVDHRRVSVGAVRGQTEITDWVGTYLDVSDPTAVRLSDVLALDERCVLVASDARGSSEVGQLASTTLWLHRWDAQGRIHLWELFGADQLDDALARVGIDEPEPRSAVRPNLAWAAVERWERLARAGDMEGVRDVYAPTYELHRHDQHIEVDRDGHTESEAQYVERGTDARVAHLVTLGECHELHRLTLAWDEDSTGQVVDYEFLVLTRVGDDGRYLQDDLFPAAAIDDALVRLVESWAEHELDDGPARARALGSVPVLLNSRAVNERDWGLYRAAFEPGAMLVDHRPTSIGEVRGVDSIVEWMQFAAAGELRTRIVRLLGMTPDAMLLRWEAVGVRDGSTFELPSIIVARIGPTGPMTRIDVFSDDRIDDAWACFDELVAPVGDNAALRLQRAWTAAVEASDLATAMSLVVADSVGDDRRRVVGVGVTTGHGVAERRTAALIEAGVESVAIEPIATRGERLALSRLTYRAGDAEATMLNLAVADPSLERLQIGIVFDADDLEAATAELDGLAAQLALPLDDTSVCFDRLDGSPCRRVRPNLATAALDASQRAAASGGIAATADLYAPGYVAERHDLLVTFDLAAYREEERWLVHETVVEVDAIATLGDRHCLYRFAYTWPGDPDVGESRVESLVVCRVDERGRFDREDLFRVDRLSDALCCLVERWAEEEAPTRVGSRARGLRAFARYHDDVAAGDWHAIRSLYADDVVLVDHRPTAAGAVHGADEVVQWLRAFVEQVSELRSRFVSVLGITPNAVALQTHSSGVANGIAFEMRPLVVARVDDEGHLDRFDVFDVEQVDAALARFDEWATVEAPGASRRRLRPNLVTAAYDRWAAGVRSGDPDARSSLDAPGYVRFDHELRAELPGRRTDLVEQGHRIVDATFDPLATLGDRHGLCRMAITWADDAGNAVCFDRLVVTRTDGAGLALREDLFPPEQVGPAVGCLLERWAEDEAPPDEARVAMRTAAIWAARRRADWEALRELYADDVTFTDHSPQGGVTRGVEQLLAWQRSLHDLADGARIEAVDVLAVAPGAVVLEMAISGSRDGGAFEARRFNVTRLDAQGQLVAVDSFPTDRLDDAWACFDRGTARPANAVTESERSLT